MFFYAPFVLIVIIVLGVLLKTGGFRNWKKLILALAVIALVVGIVAFIGLGLLGNYMLGPAASCPKLQANLEDRITSAIADAGDLSETQDGVVRLQSLTTFEWTKFYIFYPYTSVERINSTLGFEWQPSDHWTVLDYWDHSVLLMFVLDEQVVQCIEYQGRRAFDALDSSVFSPNKAVFVVRDGQLFVHKSIQ